MCWFEKGCLHLWESSVIFIHALSDLSTGWIWNGLPPLCLCQCVDLEMGSLCCETSQWLSFMHWMTLSVRWSWNRLPPFVRQLCDFHPRTKWLCQYVKLIWAASVVSLSMRWSWNGLSPLWDSSVNVIYALDDFVIALVLTLYVLNFSEGA